MISVYTSLINNVGCLRSRQSILIPASWLLRVLRLPDSGLHAGKFTAQGSHVHVGSSLNFGSLFGVPFYKGAVLYWGSKRGP